MIKQPGAPTTPYFEAKQDREWVPATKVVPQVDHDALIKQRGAQYGGSWRATAQWICEHAEELALTGDAAFAIVMIHNKLMRALASPGDRDHYDDIIGYAKLILTTFTHEETK